MKEENFKLPFNKKTIRSHELMLTENCNMRCKYCFDNIYSDRTSCDYNYKMNISMIPGISFNCRQYSTNIQRQRTIPSPRKDSHGISAIIFKWNI